MTELNIQLRNFIETGVTPVTAEEVLVVRNSAQFVASTKRTGWQSACRLLLVSGVAAIVVALVSIGIVALPGAKNSGVSTASAATFLKSEASKAANEKLLVSGPGRYLYVAKIYSTAAGATLPPSPKMFWYDVNELNQVWTSPYSTGHQTYETVGRPKFVSASDRATWVTDGSPPLGIGSESGGTPIDYDVIGLPTVSSMMLTYFKSQSYLPPESSYGGLASWKFDTALEFLQNGASPAQRKALLEFIATIPGEKLKGSATSLVTRKKGSVVALIQKETGIAEEAIFNPSTSELIELRFVRVALPAKVSPLPGPVPFVGEIVSYVDFVYAGITRLGTGFTLPRGTPNFASVWPFGAVRKPLPGWLNSASD